MALTEIRFPDSNASGTKALPYDMARSTQRKLDNASLAKTDILWAAGCALLSVASLATLLAISGIWGFSYLAAILSLSGAGGVSAIFLRRRWWLPPSDPLPVRPEPVASESEGMRDARELRREPPLQADKTGEIAAPLRDSQTEAAQAQLDLAVSETATLVARQVQRLAEALGVEQSRLTEALDLYGQSIQSRLNTSSVSLAREFRDGGEVLSRRLETVADTAVASIARQGEAVVSAIGRSAEDVDKRMVERSREALTQMDAVVARTAQAVTEMSEAAAARLGRVLDELSERAAASFARQLDETETRQRDLAKIVDGGGQALGEQAAKAAGVIETKLNAAASSLDLTVDAALQRIEAKLGERVGALSEELVLVEKEIERQWAARRDGMAAETRAAMAETAAEVGRAAHEAVNSAKRDLADNLQVSLERWLERVATSAAQVGSATDHAVETVLRREGTVTERLDAFEIAVSARSETIAEQLASQSQTMSHVLEAMEGALARQGRDLVEALEASAAGLNGTFAARLTETETRLSAERETYEQMHATHARRLDESASARAASLQEVAEAHRAGLVESLEAHRASVAADHDLALQALQAQLGAQEHAAAANLTQAARQVAEALTVELTGLADALGSRGETLRDQIVARQGELIDAIEQGVARTEAGLSQSLTATADAVSGLAADINEGFEQRGQAIAQTMQQASALVLRTLAESVSEAQTWMRRGADEAVGAMDANRRQVLEALNRGVEDAAAALDISARAGAQDLTQRGLDSQKALELETDRAVGRLEATRATLASAAAQSADHIAARLTQEVAELQRAIAAGAEQLRREFSGPLAETLARVEAEGVELAGATRVLAESFAVTSSAHREQLRSVFAREADALAATVASNADAFRRDFEATLAGADYAFVARGLDLAQALGARVAEMRALLVEEGMPLLRALDARSGDLSGQIEAASQRSLGDFERKAVGLIALLTRRGDDLLSAMTAAASETARKVADLKSEVDAGAARADASMRAVERKAGTILGLIDKRAANLSSATLPVGDEDRAVAF